MKFKILRRILNRYPAWAYGLECHICKKTFISAAKHYEYVGNLSDKHTNKIPQLG